MQEAEPQNQKDRLIRLLDPVFYGDVFDYPMTLEEIRRFCTLPVSLDELAKGLHGALAEELDTPLSEELHGEGEATKILSRAKGYYFLKGRDPLVEIRQARARESEKVWRTAQRVVNFLKYIPFIRGIMVTGSLAVDNARRKDDIDFLILVAPRRLWFVFFFLGVLQRIFSHRYLCPNYYISVDHLPMSRQSFYVAREAVQAQPIYGHACCGRFYEENRWIFETFPNACEDHETGNGAQPGRTANGAQPGRTANAESHAVAGRGGVPGFFIRTFEWLFQGGLGNLVEGMLKKVLKQRLSAHYGKHGNPVPEEVLRRAMEEEELRFHGLDHEKSILKEVETRKNRIMIPPTGS